MKSSNAIGSRHKGPEMTEAARLGRPRKLVSHMVNETTETTIARISRQPDFQKLP